MSQASDRRVGSATITPAAYTSAPKNGFMTSEFFVAVAFVAGVLVAAFTDSLSRSDGWRYATFVAMAYIISRGLAKFGALATRR
jgi:hypothetical protein